MIVQHKKLNPIIGIVLSFILIFFGMFGILFLFGDILISEELYLGVMIPFILVGTTLLVTNSTFIGLRRVANKIDENFKLMNPEMFLTSNYLVIMIRDFYIVRFNDRYLHFIRMNEKTPISVSWIRRVFLGPKLPTNLPLKCPVVTKVDGFKIRRCEKEATVYDIIDKQWYKGKATMFSLYFVSKSLFAALEPKTFETIITALKNLE